jgi:hypothetical protein
MLTRGVIIGKLIDDISQLEAQVKLRAQLGLTDLNKYCEDFIKEVLNICFGYDLKNLNADRVNEPGLDLGDTTRKIAFQVTSTNTLDKITSTLKKVTKIQLGIYSSINIFILGRKQSKYKLDPADATRCSFGPENILDIKDLCQQLIVLPYDKLYDLHKLFEREFQIVYTEFEVPDKSGTYATSIVNKLEVAPDTNCKTAKRFLAAHKGEGHQLTTIQEHFRALAKVPRISRSFLHAFILASESEEYTYRVNYLELTRRLNMAKKEIQEELGILYNRRLLSDVDEETNFISTRFDETLFAILEWARENKELSKILVALDFSLLD